MWKFVTSRPNSQSKRKHSKCVIQTCVESVAVSQAPPFFLTEMICFLISIPVATLKPCSDLQCKSHLSPLIILRHANSSHLYLNSFFKALGMILVITSFVTYARQCMTIPVLIRAAHIL